MALERRTLVEIYICVYFLAVGKSVLMQEDASTT